MTSSDTLKALAVRCEAASGSDRMLGAEVEIALRGFPERAYQQKNGMRPRGSPELDRMEWAAAFLGAGPTASIDAAMTLVPEGYRLEIRANSAAVDHRLDRKKDGRCKYAATPALALTAAALRARAAVVQEGR